MLDAETKRRIDSCRDIFNNAYLHGFADPHYIEAEKRAQMETIRQRRAQYTPIRAAGPARQPAHQADLRRAGFAAILPGGGPVLPELCAG